MKFLLCLLLSLTFLPIFAQELPLSNVTNQFENQINYENLQKLENRVSDVENKINENQNNPSFDDQFVSSAEYAKLMERLHTLENKQNDNGILSVTDLITIIALAVNGVLVFFIYKTFRQNSEHHISINRPWISLRLKNIDGDENCEFSLKNEGRLVAENMKIICKDRNRNNKELDIVHK